MLSVMPWWPVEWPHVSPSLLWVDIARVVISDLLRGDPVVPGLRPF